MSTDTSLPNNIWPYPPSPFDSVVCILPGETPSAEAAIIFTFCFFHKGMDVRRYSAVVRDLRRLFDAIDKFAGVRRDPRNEEIAKKWVNRVVVEPDSPLRVRPSFMRFAE